MRERVTAVLRKSLIPVAWMILGGLVILGGIKVYGYVQLLHALTAHDNAHHHAAPAPK